MTEKHKKSNGILKLILIVVPAILLVLFAIANSENVTIGLIITETQAPLTAVMIVSFLLGLVLGLVFLILSSRGNKKIIKAKDKEISQLEERLGYMNEKLDELNKGLQD